MFPLKKKMYLSTKCPRPGGNFNTFGKSSVVVLEETLRVLSLAAEVVLAHEHNVDVVDQRANVLSAEVVGEDRPHALDRGAAGLDEDELLRKRHPLRGFGGNRTDYFSDLSAANRLFQQSESTTRFYY